MPRTRRTEAEPATSTSTSTLITAQGLIFLAKSFFLAIGASLIVLLILAGVLVYTISKKRNTQESVNPGTYLVTKYVPLNFKGPQGNEHEGWLLLGLPGAPAVILCHGYDSNRAEVLSQGFLLQQNHFNVFIFNFHSKESNKLSSLGVREKDILLAAVQAVTKQDKVNPNRVGVWGVSVGGYAALAAAEESDLIAALAIDSVYAEPRQFMEAQIDHYLGGSSAIFRFLADLQFRLLNLTTDSLNIEENLESLGDRPKLFLSGRDVPALAALTQRMYDAAPDPKQILILDRSRTSILIGNPKSEYENQILNFFLQNLPLRAN